MLVGLFNTVAKSGGEKFKTSPRRKKLYRAFVGIFKIILRKWRFILCPMARHASTPDQLKL